MADPGAIAPASAAPNALGAGSSTNSTPAMMALPVTATSDSDTGATHKWYTISVGLRETYDDNVNTTSTNQETALETSISPNLLVDFPTADGDFSARYSFGLTYYGDLNNANNNGSGSNNFNGGGATSTSTLDYTNELTAQLNHSFSPRFSLQAADDFRYYTDPSILESTGTNYRNGAYFANTLNASFSGQWTPLVGTTTSYSNTIVAYEKQEVADTQNSIENSGTQSVSFAILPKISLNFGATLDNITYETSTRGYTSYTGFTGLTWLALPTLTVNGNVGGTYTQTDSTQVQGFAAQSGQDQVSPYGTLGVNWNLGQKSVLTANYSHAITPTDQAFANGQTSDRFSVNFGYAITPSISSHLTGIYTIVDITSGLAATSSAAGYTENDYEFDAGLTYHYNSFLDFDADATISGVSTDQVGLDYSRDRLSIGVQGTY